MSRVALSAALATAAASVWLTAPALAGEANPTLAELESEVICPTCHTTLDQSTAPVAQRMRAYIRARIEAGDTKSEIKGKLVAQFGEQVLASPPKRGFNLLAWVLPPAGVLAGAVAMGVLAVRWSRRRTERGDSGDEQPAPSRAVERRIDEELARFDG